MVLEKRLHRSSLIAWHSENVTETSSGEDNLFACAFGIVHGISWVNLRCTDGSHERAGDGETGIEANTISRGPSYVMQRN